jgi:hypothetical protein
MKYTRNVQILPGLKLGRVSLCADGSAVFDLPTPQVRHSCIPPSFLAHQASDESDGAMHIFLAWMIFFAAHIV